MTHRYRDPAWKKSDWYGLYFLVLVGLWLALPSSLMLRPLSMSISQDADDGRWMVTTVRETPWGAVDATWWATIRVTGAGREGEACQGSGLGRYEPAPSDTNKYAIGEWAFDCLRAGPPLVITYTRQVWFAGVIPMRPVRQVFEVNLPNTGDVAG